MEEVMQQVGVAFEEYERAVYVDQVHKCYSELDRVYQTLHEGHSPAYRSGSILYVGETLPFPVFVAIILSLSVLSGLQRLIENQIRIVYTYLRDRTRNIHVDLWLSKYEDIGVE